MRNVRQLDPGHEWILLRLRNEGLPVVPPLPRVHSGYLGGVELTGELALEDGAEGHLYLLGKDRGVCGALLDADARPNHSRRFVVDEKAADLLLCDGSRIYAEDAWLSDFSRMTSSSGWDTTLWKARLASWFWWRHEDVHTWLALVERGPAPATQNLWIPPEGWAGFHLPGGADVPGFTIVKLMNRNSMDCNDRYEPLLAVLIDAFKLQNPFKLIDNVSLLIGTVLGVELPTRFYGLDDRGELCALISTGPEPLPVLQETAGSLSRSEGASLLVPARLGDWFRGEQRRVWLAPLLSRLRDDFFGAGRLLDVMAIFHDAIHEPIRECQIAKLGTVLRVLVFSERGAIRKDRYLDPEFVWSELETLAHGRRVRLPDSAKEALFLSHQIALLSGFGIGKNLREAYEYLCSDVGFDTLNVLRATFASLVASSCGYQGPVSLRAESEGRSTECLDPLGIPDPAARAEDERLAGLVFQAGRADVTP